MREKQLKLDGKTVGAAHGTLGKLQDASTEDSCSSYCCNVQAPWGRYHIDRLQMKAFGTVLEFEPWPKHNVWNDDPLKDYKTKVTMKLNGVIVGYLLLDADERVVPASLSSSTLVPLTEESLAKLIEDEMKE